VVKKPFGIYAPTITAFNADESLNEQGTRAFVRFLLEAHAHGLAPLGSESEFAALSERERMQVLEWTLTEANGQVSVLAGTSHYRSRTTIELSKHAKQSGASGLLLMPPFLLRPPKREVMDHFRRVREAAGLPIVVDNAPSLAGVELSPGELMQLAGEDVIHGVRWSHPEVARIHETKLICPPNFAVFVGDDLIGFAGLAAGADGYAGALAMMVPRLVRTLFGQFRESQNLNNARDLWGRLLPLVQFQHRGRTSDTGSPHGLAVSREAAALRGIPVGSPRAPLQPLFPDQKAELKRLLTQLGEL
jgi:4-hydroxy-tetrahydrodipicolinate synthase